MSAPAKFVPCKVCGKWPSYWEHSSALEANSSRVHEYVPVDVPMHNVPVEKVDAYDKYKMIERIMKADDDQSFENIIADIKMIIETGQFPT